MCKFLIIVNLQIESNANICEMKSLFCFENLILFLLFAFECANL